MLLPIHWSSLKKHSTGDSHLSHQRSYKTFLSQILWIFYENNFQNTFKQLATRWKVSVCFALKSLLHISAVMSTEERLWMVNVFILFLDWSSFSWSLRFYVHPCYYFTFRRYSPYLFSVRLKPAAAQCFILLSLSFVWRVVGIFAAVTKSRQSHKDSVFPSIYGNLENNCERL